MSEATTKAPKVVSAIARVMAEVGAVGKSRKNSAQNYAFRGVDDVAHVQEVMAKCGLVVIPRVVEREREMLASKSGGSMVSVRLLVEHTFYCEEDGSSVVCTTLGEAMDSGDKASNKAMSAALKYCLTESLLIPTYEVDRDTEDHSPQAGPPVATSRPLATPPKSAPPSPPSNVRPITQSHEAAIAEWAAKFASCTTLAELDAAGRELAKSSNVALKQACRTSYDMRRTVLARAS
jgi:hypothetical protein